MRMWMVDPRWMCSKHLLGEHVECHMFLGSLLKAKTLDGFIDKGLLEFKSLKGRHDALVSEMVARGMNHQSPLPESPLIGSIKILESTVNREKSEQELLNRCVRCQQKHQLFIKKD